ncbi:MAG: hypothetical protein KBG22_09835 [Smithella sp.]|nr:hypothetical protein [Smithella sp.]HQH17726.1 hypothetical protein [Smithella sp.]
MKKFFLCLVMVSFAVFFIGCNNQKTTQEPMASQEKIVEQVNEQTPQPIVAQPLEQSPVVEKKTAEVYDLQERCGKSSEEYFRNRLKEEGSYICHYNRKLNKCFLHSFTSSGEKLIDIQENKIYGKCSYSGVSCYYYDNENMIRNEWEKLIKTFMEE